MANPLNSIMQSVKRMMGSSSAEGSPETAQQETLSISRAPADQSSPDPEERPLSMAHVWVADPNAMKLQLSRRILPANERREYRTPEQLAESPLAQSLFEIAGIDAVILDTSAVTVYMTEDSDWDAAMSQVPNVIKEHVESGLHAVEGLDPNPPKKKYNFGFKQVEKNSRPREEQFRIVKTLLDEEVNPAVAAHGGFFELLDVRDDTVYVQLGGGCQGCGMVDVTLRQGVEQRLREVLPEMVALVDTTDHAQGTNPYYQPGK